MEQLSLTAKVRGKMTKGELKRLREQGYTPGIFYGREEENVPIYVDTSTLIRVIRKARETNVFIELKIEKEGDEINKLCLIKDVDYHPLKRIPYHFDIYSVKAGEEIEVEVPVVITGTAPGVKKGGLLQVIRRELTLRCLPKHMPEKIEVDVSDLDIGDAIHIEDLKVENVKFIYDTNFTIVTVVPPESEKEEETEEVEAEESEE